MHHSMFPSTLSALRNRVSSSRTRPPESKRLLLEEACPNYRDAHAHHLAVVYLSVSCAAADLVSAAGSTTLCRLGRCNSDIIYI